MRWRYAGAYTNLFDGGKQSFFVDGLSQTFLEKYGEEAMPETFAFFREGIICTEAYSTADWTYPGVASAMTGLEISRHMMINDILSVELPKEVPLFTEYARSAGYYMAKIDGDWRQTPNLGYCRGVDRIIYQSHNGGMFGDMVLNDAMDQIEMLKETNQCVCIGIGDLQKTDANLPVFFGGKEERRWAVTQTIHHGNPYEAALHGRKYRVFVSGDNWADEFGRFRWEKEKVWIYENGSDTPVEDGTIHREVVTMLKERTRHLWEAVEKE